jgi:hypothetical protein
VSATTHCDACKRALTATDFGDEDIVRHWAEFRPRFGYGSRLDRTDSLANYDVCEECWEKALRAVGLDPNPEWVDPSMTPEVAAELGKVVHEALAAYEAEAAKSHAAIEAKYEAQRQRDTEDLLYVERDA